MLDRNKYILTWWDKVKLGIGIMCSLLVIVQVAAAFDMIGENKADLKMIEPSHYQELREGEEIAGVIKKEDMITKFEGSNPKLSNYLVRVSEDKVIVMKMPVYSACDLAMSALLTGDADSMTYKGRVNILTETDKAGLNLTVLTGDELYKHGMERDLNKFLLNWTVDTTLYELKNEDKYIYFALYGAALMLAAAVWAFWKPFKKIGRQYAARMGKLDLELLKKEDLPVEQGWFTDEDAPVGNNKMFTSYDNLREPMSTEPVEFYQSGLNEEGNFYVEPKEEGSVSEDEEGFHHEHKNY